MQMVMDALLLEGGRGDGLERDLPMASEPQVFLLGELFAGAGGMALGAHLAQLGEHGFSQVWVNDMDADACRTLASNLDVPESGVFCCKVEDLDFDSLPRVDGLAFGFPCNDFSVVGDRHGIAGRHGGLFTWCVKALENLQPLFFVAENVGGLASSGGRRDFRTILSALQGTGYEVWTRVYKFEEYGLPQARHRIIMVGFREDLRVAFCPPEPPVPAVFKTSAQALADIPEDAPNHEKTRHTAVVVDRLNHIRPGENAFTADLPSHLRLNLKSGAEISQIYRRLLPDRPSYTVTGSGGGGTHLYHWEEPRALTNRERARLQTFPDWFVFCGGKESVRRQIGMAVPPRGAEIIFRAVLKTLLNSDIQPISYQGSARDSVRRQALDHGETERGLPLMLEA